MMKHGLRNVYEWKHQKFNPEALRTLTDTEASVFLWDLRVSVV